MGIREIFDQQRSWFAAGHTLPLAFRRRALQALRNALRVHEPRLLEALRADLGRSEIDAYTAELGLVQREIELACRDLPRWMKRQSRPGTGLNWPSRSYRYPRPRGVVLILGPWNYPLQLVLLPLVGALAAGNCAVVKPSELAPRSAAALEHLLVSVFPPGHACAVSGDAQAAAGFLELPWDHIFFTGSTRVGRLVMQAAARRPTSVTLELGGKNPCLVMPDAPLAITAERIVWGKFFNAGQTCGAPDHVYAHASILEPLTAALARAIVRFYGTDPSQSPAYGRIINEAHWKRLSGYLSQGRVRHGGLGESHSRYLAPTLLTEVHPDAPIMHEEIFGPILPLLPFDDLDALLSELRTRPKPLAAYCFTRSSSIKTRFLTGLAAGTAAVNDTLGQITSPHLPVGGVGESGQGQYHGRASFDCFTHYQSVLDRPFSLNLRMKYPPYRLSLAALKRIYRWLV